MVVVEILVKLKATVLLPTNGAAGEVILPDIKSGVEAGTNKV